MNKKRFFSTLLLIVLLLASGCQSPKFIPTGLDDQRFPAQLSQADCLLAIQRILTESTSGEKVLQQRTVDYFENVKTIDYTITKGRMTKVRNILKSLGVTESEAKQIREFDKAIEKALQQIMGDTPGSIEKGEKMALIGKQLRELYADHKNPETLRDLDFFLGNAVQEAESFSLAEFKYMPDNTFVMDKNSRLFHIGYKDYKPYFLGFKNNTAPFTTLDRTGGTIITHQDIRDIEAHNLFPVYINHDMTHVVYSVSHERYFPTLFAAARSKNHYRYALIGALGEGVDTVQYSEETAINRYFDTVKKLSLEEAMMFLARATNEELRLIAKEINSESRIQGIADGFANWTPKKSDRYTGIVDGASLSEDGITHFHTTREMHTDPDILPYFDSREPRPNYHGRAAR